MRIVHTDALMDHIIHNSVIINADDINMRGITSNMNKK